MIDLVAIRLDIIIILGGSINPNQNQTLEQHEMKHL